MRRRKKLNENTLRKIIRESIKSIIREESEVPYDVYGGIDDYPENETSEEQWRKLQNAQYGEPSGEQWNKDWREFRNPPKWMFSEPGEDADFQLGLGTENAFQRNGRCGSPGFEGMHALDPDSKYAREPRMYNGWEHHGNPASANYSDEDNELPQEYLNESISRAIKKVIGRKK